MVTPNFIFDGRFSDARMTTLVVKQGDFFPDGTIKKNGFVFSFWMAIIIEKNVRSGVLRATCVALII